jgi:YbgC/YbaW family acyl-CoA thioester hydrolase
VSGLRFRRRVQFAETDMAGVVHFSWYFRYMEEAEHALWREAGLSVASPGQDIAWPRVAASCEYRRPLRFEDEFEVCVRVASMTAKTITFASQVVRDGEEIARGQMTVACVIHGPGQPMKGIPNEIALERSPSSPRLYPVECRWGSPNIRGRVCPKQPSEGPSRHTLVCVRSPKRSSTAL